MSEHMKTNREWFKQEKTENKMKMLQLYQFSIQYATNTSYIFANSDYEARII